MQETIIVAIIGAVVSVFTLVAGKVYETKTQMRKLKEEQYISFLTNIVKVKTSDGSDCVKEKEELSVKIQTMYLVGNVGMQKALKEYLEIFSGDNIVENQDVLYGKLVQAMKIDLYGRVCLFLPKKFRSIDKIKFLIFK